jgi:hypothetical protein
MVGELLLRMLQTLAPFCACLMLPLCVSATGLYGIAMLFMVPKIVMGLPLSF